MLWGGGGAGAGLCVCRAFVCWLSARWSMSLFSLPPGVGGWLRLLLVALPGLFYLPFYSIAALLKTVTIQSISIVLFT